MSISKKDSDIFYEEITWNHLNGFMLAFSVIGDHEVNQDSFSYSINENVIKLAIADGLGSSKYSDIGSSFATEIAIESNGYEQDLDYFDSVFKRWKLKLKSKNILDFDTTLKSVYVYDNYLKFHNVGDGVAYIETDNETFLFTTSDEFINQTDSLCTYKTNKNDYHISLSYQNSLCLVLYTDGIEQFMSSERLADFANEFKILFKSKDSIKKNVEEWIKSWKSKNYYDDKTMLILYLSRR